MIPSGVIVGGLPPLRGEEVIVVIVAGGAYLGILGTTVLNRVLSIEELVLVSLDTCSVEVSNQTKSGCHVEKLCRQ